MGGYAIPWKAMRASAIFHFAPQPNFAVKPTPTSSACRFPARFALRCGLPVALGFLQSHRKIIRVESKDYISIVALLLSIASLGMSIRTFLFNKSTKGVELRAQLLVKIADAKNIAANTEATILRLDPDSKEAQQFWPRASAFRQKLEALYSRVETIEAKKGVELYGIIFHDVHDLYTQILDMKKLAEAELAMQIKKENIA